MREFKKDDEVEILAQYCYLTLRYYPIWDIDKPTNYSRYDIEPEGPPVWIKTKIAYITGTDFKTAEQGENYQGVVNLSYWSWSYPETTEDEMLKYIRHYNPAIKSTRTRTENIIKTIRGN